MDFSNLIAKKDADFNEEQTKHALVLPVLDRFLGWDVYDEKKLIPEFTADTPGKNGERVDYALDVQGDGKPEILIEVKPIGSRLNSKVAAQLYRYFTATEATIGILTDGFRWMLYTDLEKPNIMDNEPFLDFNLEDLSSSKPLEKLFLSLSQAKFDADYLRAWGESARDSERLEALVKKELSTPSEDLVRHFYSQLHPGARGTASRIEAFKKRLEETLQKQLGGYEDSTTASFEKSMSVTVSYDVKKKIVRTRRMGYFSSEEGFRGTEGSLKQSWISFWSEVAKDDHYRELLENVALGNSPHNAIKLEGSKSFTSIGYGLYIASILSSERRMELLKDISSAIGLKSEIVYTDGIVSEDYEIEDEIED